MNPYKILNVSKNCNIDQLREAFKQTALKVHPDKGGNAELFKICVEAYKHLFQKLKSEQSYKSFKDMKNESIDNIKNMKKTKHVKFKDQVDNQNEDFITKFNRVFNDNKFDDVNDTGYADFMVKSTKNREDIDIKKKVKNFKDFNTMFDDEETMNKEVVVYKEPEALDICSKKLSYDELGVTNIDDFSSDTTNNRSLMYTDYKKAHTTNKLIDKNMLHKKQEFKNMEDIKNKRSSQSFELSDEDRRVIEEGLRKEKDKEKQRQINMNKYDENIQTHFEKVNRLMLS